MTVAQFIAGLTLVALGLFAVVWDLRQQRPPKPPSLPPRGKDGKFRKRGD